MLDGLQDVAVKVGESVKTFVAEKPIASTVIGVGTAGAIVGGVLVASRKKKATKKRTTRGRSRDRKFISKQKHEIRRKRKRKPAKIYKKKGKYWRRKPLKKAKPRRLIKGSKEAKRYMAKLRRMRKGGKR